VAGWYAVRVLTRPGPGCVVTAVPGTGSGDHRLTVEQAGNAATIAAVGIRMGIPDHAVSVALATAMQESRLRNLPGGDRDSAGLFQQRPSEGWGTYAEVTDPVHAATAFYDHLRQEPGWSALSVTRAAQLVQHSATPDAYARWEPEARAAASALTGERTAALSCHDLGVAGPAASVRATALAELGTARVGGAHDRARGWALGSWLVAHAARLRVDTVTFDGRTWTARSGKWTPVTPATDVLTLHVARDTTGSG
jgi:hypothetical protein